MLSSLKKSLSVYTLIPMVMLLLTYPYVFFAVFHLPGESVMAGVFFVVTIFLFFFGRKKKYVFPKGFFVCIVIQVVTWLFYTLIHMDSSYLTRIFFMVLALFVIKMLFSNDGFYKFHYLNISIVTVQAVLGIIAFVLVFLNMLQPLFEFYVDSRGTSFFGITCSNVVYGNFIRPSGYFDEPGALAFWGFFALIMNKLVFNNKFIEFALAIGLLSTFSAAYFILLPLYIICFYSTHLKSLLVAGIISCVLGYFAYSNLEQEAHFLEYTTERFEGGEVRSMRNDLAIAAKKRFLENPFVGIGAKQLNQGEYLADNQYEILAKDGMIGFIVTYLPLLYLVFKFRRRKEIVLGSGLLFIDYFQRPFHINVMHFFILYSFILFIYESYGRKQYCQSEIKNLCNNSLL